MKICIVNTTQTTVINGIPVRVWEGYTESGIKVVALVTRVAIDKDEPLEVIEQFRKELEEQAPPSEDVAVFPLRMIL